MLSLLAAADRTSGRFDRSPLDERHDDIGRLLDDTRIGAWRIVRLIGHGGVGSVYEVARAKGGFDQRAALKVIQYGAGVLVAGSLVAGIVGVGLEARQAILARNYFQAEVDRGNAVRDFMASLMRDDSSDARAANAAMVQLIERRAGTLDRAYPTHPEKYARVTEFLTSLFSDMTNEIESATIAESFLRSPATAADPTTTARVRFNYVQSLMLLGKPAEAQRQIGLAQSFWASDPADHLAELARSRIAEAQIERIQGNPAGAVVALRKGLAEAEAATGKTDEDVPDLENSLALALLERGQFDEADLHLAHARSYWETKGREDDSLVTIIQNQAAVALARGDYARAEALLNESITRRKADFGASAALGAAEADLANAQLLEKKYAAARTNADEALALAHRYLGDHGSLHAYAEYERMTAACGAGDADAATRAAAVLAETERKVGAARALALACRLRLAGAAASPAERSRTLTEIRTNLASLNEGETAARLLVSQMLGGPAPK